MDNVQCVRKVKQELQLQIWRALTVQQIQRGRQTLRTCARIVRSGNIQTKDRQRAPSVQLINIVELEINVWIAELESTEKKHQPGSVRHVELGQSGLQIVPRVVSCAQEQREQIMITALARNVNYGSSKKMECVSSAHQEK